MEIQKRCYTPTFNAKFVNNESFKDVVKWAAEHNQLRALDSSLHTISKANKGDIFIFHGKTPDGNIYSNFRFKKRSLINSAADVKSPAEASFDGINELGLLGRAYRSLFGVNKAEYNVTPEEIIKNYSV